MVAVATQDGYTSPAAEQLLGVIYSKSAGMTRRVCSDSGFAASYYCTGQPVIWCDCLVAKDRTWPDNRPQTKSIATVVG